MRVPDTSRIRLLFTELLSVLSSAACRFKLHWDLVSDYKIEMTEGRLPPPSVVQLA